MCTTYYTAVGFVENLIVTMEMVGKDVIDLKFCFRTLIFLETGPRCITHVTQRVIFVYFGVTVHIRNWSNNPNQNF